MAQSFPPPAALNLQGNLKENWRRFEQQIWIYLSATEISKKSAEIQANTLLHVIGPDALEIYNTFTWVEQGDEKKLDKILETFAASTILRKMSHTNGMFSIGEINYQMRGLTRMSRNCVF